MGITWFYKLRVDERGTAWFSMWTVEGDSFVQSSASMRVSYVLTDRYWDGFGFYLD